MLWHYAVDTLKSLKVAHNISEKNHLDMEVSKWLHLLKNQGQADATLPHFGEADGQGPWASCL